MVMVIVVDGGGSWKIECTHPSIHDYMLLSMGVKTEWQSSATVEEGVGGDFINQTHHAIISPLVKVH